MEDSHTHILSLPDDPGTSFFAVYDGHAGAKVAEYAGKHLHKLIIKRKEYAEGDIAAAIRNAFLELDEIMKTDESLRNESAGSTAVTVLIKDNKLYCANIGDSRCIASIKGNVEPLSFDHKPLNPDEFKRITEAGGFVQYNRVNGNLALSRAFGDYIYKNNDEKTPLEQMVIPYPDVEEREITKDWEFIVLACDGIWDVMSNQEVVKYVRENIAAGLEPEEICESMMMKCLAPDGYMAGRGSDNMTVVIVGLLHGESYEELVKRCSVPNTQLENVSDTEDYFSKY